MIIISILLFPLLAGILVYLKMVEVSYVVRKQKQQVVENINPPVVKSEPKYNRVRNKCGVITPKKVTIKSPLETWLEVNGKKLASLLSSSEFLIKIDECKDCAEELCIWLNSTEYVEYAILRDDGIFCSTVIGSEV